MNKKLAVLITLFSIGFFTLFSTNTYAQVPSVTEGGGGSTSSSNGKCRTHFLFIPTWYRGLTDSNCNIQLKADEGGNTGSGISKIVWTIALNLIQGLATIVAYATVIYMIYGSMLYSLAQGDPKKLGAAKSTISNAIIGFVISLISAVIVNFIFGVLSK
jgi:hypothetical protein